MGTIALFLGGEPQAWLFLVGTLVGSTYLYFKFFRVRHVALEGEVFHIYDHGRNCRVHVSQLKSVEASRWSNPETVALYFKTDTGFGDRVVFIARFRWLAGFGEHPVADELRRLARKQSAR